MKCTCVIRKSRAFPEGFVVEMCGNCSDKERARINRDYSDYAARNQTKVDDDNGSTDMRRGSGLELDDRPPWEQDNSIPMDEDDEEDLPWRR